MELDFIHALETKVREQLGAQRVGYLLGAGSSYLDGRTPGRPLVYWFLSFLEPKRALLETPLTKWTYG